MRMKRLGNTGLLVSELCLGTMTFGGGEGIWASIGALQQPEVDALMGAAIDKGVNFFDTANVYSAGRSEIATGQALRNLRVPRDQFVLATKVLDGSLRGRTREVLRGAQVGEHAAHAATSSLQHD